MGVKISGILEKKEISLEELSGKKLAVDAYNTLFQFLSIIRSYNGTPLMDEKGRITSHLTGLFYRTCALLEKNITPIYVFDGKSSVLKKKTIEERENIKIEAEKAFKKAVEEGNEQKASMYAQRTSRLTKEMVGEAKKLLDLMGLPWVQAPSEGEAQCSYMTDKNITDVTASQDFDCMLFGTPILARNIAVSGKKKIPKRNSYAEVTPEEFNLKENLEKLGIDRRKLVWIGILSGTDFNEGVMGIGAKKGLKLVKKHDSFEDILRELNIEMEWKEVEDLFLKPEVMEVEKNELRIRNLEKNELTDFMTDYGFSRERIENAVKRGFKDIGSTQNRLQKWW
jgi:flap endonuclease-1